MGQKGLRSEGARDELLRVFWRWEDWILELFMAGFGGPLVLVERFFNFREVNHLWHFKVE